jgi:hypothetical protein
MPSHCSAFAAVGVLDVGSWSLDWSTKRVQMITVLVRDEDLRAGYPRQVPALTVGATRWEFLCLGHSVDGSRSSEPDHV